MSIAHTTRFTRHAWAMPDVPGLPSGVWTASNDNEGDATGGLITFQHIFRNQSNNLGDNQLYNIEQVMIASQDPAQSGAKLTIRGMDPGTGQPSSPNPIDRVWFYDLANTDSLSGFQNATPPDETTIPVWVGTYSGPDTALGDVIVALENVDSVRVLVAIYGYYWAPSAVNAPGGIQRPPNGLWRS